MWACGSSHRLWSVWTLHGNEFKFVLYTTKITISRDKLGSNTKAIDTPVMSVQVLRVWKRDIVTNEDIWGGFAGDVSRHMFPIWLPNIFCIWTTLYFAILLHLYKSSTSLWHVLRLYPMPSPRLDDGRRWIAVVTDVTWSQPKWSFYSDHDFSHWSHFI